MCKKPILLLVVLTLIAAAVAQGADPSLIGWWKLNDGAGNIAVDASGKGNNGTLREDAAWEAEGYWDGALLLDGDGDYVDCGNDPIYNVTDAVTLAAWVRADADFSYPDWSGIIMRGGPNLDTFALYYNGPSQLMGFKLTGTSGTEWHSIGAAGLFDDEWHHTAATYDGQTKVIYLDGEPLLTEAISGQIETSNGRLLLGAGRDLSPPTHYLAGLIDDARVYGRGLSQAEIQAVMLDPGDTELAADPVPVDGAVDVPRDAVLAWTPGELAQTHDVYLGTSFADVNMAGRDSAMGLLVSESQDANTYDPPGLLDWGQTYYWRIDEVNGAPDYAIFQGDVWSLTVEPFGYPIENIIATSNAASGPGEGPENTVNGSGLNADDEHSIEAFDMWLATPGADAVYIQYEFDVVYQLHEMLVWNYNIQFELVLGFGLKDVTVEYSENGVDWTLLGDVELAQGTAAADYLPNTVVDLQGVAARYVRLTVNSGYGVMGQLGLSEVRFLHIPVQASLPVPAVGATEVSLDPILSWRAGREAASHEIYLSTDEAAVVDGTALIDTVGDSTYAPADLQLGSTYYWKVNEVNEAAAIASWEGSLWSFTTQEYAVVEDFESYDDEENLIFDTWIDGWVNETGSTVGYLAEPFAEQTIVNSGRQSMPLEYNNSAAPFYSEAERDLGGVDWSANGADTLRLHIRGNSDNAPSPFYVAVEDTAGQIAVATHADAQIALTTDWQEWQIPLAEFAGVNLSSVRMIYVGLGNRDNPSAGGAGLIFIDDIEVGHPVSALD
jgi:Concanavalin A-like lectin/glucanases superfamily/F5/8 type C domain